VLERRVINPDSKRRKEKKEKKQCYWVSPSALMAIFPVPTASNAVASPVTSYVFLPMSTATVCQRILRDARRNSSHPLARTHKFLLGHYNNNSAPPLSPRWAPISSHGTGLKSWWRTSGLETFGPANEIQLKSNCNGLVALFNNVKLTGSHEFLMTKIKPAHVPQFVLDWD
jgi:hypothetical protein